MASAAVSQNTSQHEGHSASPMDVELDSSLSQPSQTAIAIPPKQATNVLSKLFDSDEDNEDAPPVARTTKGNLLSHLRPQADRQMSESEEEDAEAAYERVKRILTRKASQPEDPRPERASGNVESESENDLPVKAKSSRRNMVPRATTPASPRSERASSPGLFVTPNATPLKPRTARQSASMDGESGSDVPTKSRRNKDLEARVKRIRAERRARQQEEQKRQQQESISKRDDDDASDSDVDGANGTRLTQSTRPARKAGKRALEEMAREQQRISRNMQLTHQAKTKKKHSVKDLLSRLGYNQVDTELVPATGLPTPETSSALTSSDAEVEQQPDLSTSSTNLQNKSDMRTASPTYPEAQTSEVLPNIPSPRQINLAKGKGRAPEFQHLPKNSLTSSKADHTKGSATIAHQAISHKVDEMVDLSDSDDEVQVVPSKSRFPVFDRLPQRKQQETAPLLHLRHLAHLTSPSKQIRKGQSTINTTQLQFQLAQKARQQAHDERMERIDDLKRRGIHVETEEEREKHQLEIEDMVAQFEKARQEDLKLAKLERKEARQNGESRDGLLSSDESDDGDYVGSGEEEAQAEDDEHDEDMDVDLSGSEDEEDDEVEDVNEPIDAATGLIEDAADQTEADGLDLVEEQDHDATADADEEGMVAPARQRTTTRRRNYVIDEDEEDINDLPAATSPTQVAFPIASQSQKDDAMAAFGFQKSSAPVGLTQMFAGTMANLESESQFDHPLDHEQEQDSLDFLRALPDSYAPDPMSQAADMSILNSQHLDSQSPMKTPARLSGNLGMATSPLFADTQLSEAPMPTQDAGFELSRAPAGLAPPSTVDTVMLSTVVDSPLVKRKGKLQRRRQIVDNELSDADDDLVAAISDVEQAEKAINASDAFSRMKKAAKKAKRVDDFNKKTSWARDAVQEQAEESEDEYAGIGGASDDDSGEEDEELAKMIDTNDVKVDERELAAFYAKKEMATDEKNINQLYKDIMNGGLRKRRGADAFDMSDSEDEAEQRRRRKQTQFRQMTKALVSDERIGKIAQNPKQSAFFKTLADHTEDPDYEFLNVPELAMEAEGSQSDSQFPPESQGISDSITSEVAIPDSQTVQDTTSINPLKRKSPEIHEKENRPPPHLRRTAAQDSMARKPMTLSDIQHSVSELLEDPRVMVPDSQYTSDSDLEIEPAQQPLNRKPIIDRLSLSRQSTISESAGADNNMAFHAPSTSHLPGFKVPSLVRRATSNLSEVSRTSSGANTPTTTEGGVRRGGTGRSNIHAQAREAERRAKVEKSELRRKEVLKRKVGKARGQRSVLGCLDGGFE